MAFPDQAKFSNRPLIKRPVYSRHKCRHGYIPLSNRVIGPYYKLRPAFSSFDLWPKRTLMSRNARRFCLITTSYIFVFMFDRTRCVLVNFYIWGHFVMFIINSLHLISVHFWTYLSFIWGPVYMKKELSLVGGLPPIPSHLLQSVYMKRVLPVDRVKVDLA